MIKFPMKHSFITLGALATLLSCSHQPVSNTAESGAQNSAARELTTVAEFKGAQVTGVTVSDQGRVFANFPRWRDNIPFSVVEIEKDGSYRPYPDQSWNQWNGHPEKNHFTCIQSVIAHGNSLYVLDPSSPKMAGVVDRAKLYEFDLRTNRLKHTWTFDQNVAPQKSYLNDLRVDDVRKKIYITDSGMGAIIVLDPKTGKARRLLANHPSTKAEDITLTIRGKPFLRDGVPPRVNSDGIALNTRDGYLYYHALTGYHLYRVPTKALVAAFKRPRLERQLESSVVDLGKTPAPDGMIEEQSGDLIMGDLEKDAIIYRTPKGELKTLIQDPRVRWADTFAIDPHNNLLFTTSRIDEVPADGNIEPMTFSIYRLPLQNEPESYPANE